MKKKLLIHHHCTYELRDNDYYSVSFISHWVNQLTKYFDVGLLIHESRLSKSNNDTLIAPKVKIHSLGLEGKRWDRLKRIRRIRNVCQKVSEEYDILLIRGITPRQMTIYNHCNISEKFYLLVGSIKSSTPHWSKIFKTPYEYLMHFWRKFELKKISKKSKLFANSPTVVDELKVFYGISAKYVATNSIKSNEIRDTVKVIDTDKVISLLFCGRIEKDKGIEELLHALIILNADRFRFKLNIIGKGADSYVKNLVDFSEKNNILTYIEFLGFVPYGGTLFEYYFDADIFVIPSYHEGFPHVIWESAAMATPVIVTNVGGIPGIVSDEEVELIESHSYLEIVNSVKNILSNQNLSNRKVKRLRELLKQNTLEESVESLYKSIMNENNFLE